MVQMVQNKEVRKKSIRHRFFVYYEIRSFFRSIHNSIHLPNKDQ